MIFVENAIFLTPAFNATLKTVPRNFVDGRSLLWFLFLLFFFFVLSDGLNWLIEVKHLRMASFNSINSGTD